MKVLVIGSGGREHALIWKISQSPKVDKIYAAPGNAGIADLAETVNIKAEDIESLLAFAKQNEIDLTVVGPEVPLVLGISDLFEKAGLRVFGPGKHGALFEGSKAFTKAFMEFHKIPTAEYREYTSIEGAKEDIGIYGYPMVIKADGLAAGKGVVIAQDRHEAEKAVGEMMEDLKFGEAGAKIVYEEFLDGIEASILCFVDGKTIIPMASAQDYKKIFDGDKGPNTGGMGTYCPSKIYNDEIAEYVQKEILDKFVEGVQKEAILFKGVLFVGLMIKNNKAKVIEFNVRFGDPETQVILPRMKNDLVDVMDAVIDQKLDQVELEWIDESAVCVVMASGGYPESYEKGKVITGLETLKDEMVFHAGTRKIDDDIVSNGGRVLNVVAMGDSIEEARAKAYGNVEKLDFEKKTYRTDIGLLIGK